jgi:glycosyltransferase involved in cell wall biosynthesis
MPAPAEDRNEPAGTTVFVDVEPMSERKLTGIGRYTARLALALASTPGCRVRFRAVDAEIVAPQSLDWSQDQDLARWSRRVWCGPRLPFCEVEIPPESIGVYPCLRTTDRLFPFEVSVIHDFTPLLFPWAHRAKTRAEFRDFFARGLLASDAAITPARSTKADAHWLCDFDPARLVVAPSGPSLCIQRHLDVGSVKRRPEVGLVVSTIEPRKNADFLLEWFHETTVLPEGAELWWVGPVGWLMSPHRLRAYRRQKGGRRVRFFGLISDPKLCRLYRSAGWTVYPTLYEGFGFPVVDSLRHGTPVLSAYHSSLREFELPGVFSFDPYDAATLDAAWHAQSEAGGAASVVPQDVLDDRFNWQTVARAVLGLPAATARQRTAA